MRPEDMKLILASGSPRRTELLSTALLAHEVMVSGADEDVTAPDPRSLVELLSARKAQEVYERCPAASDFAVIGADTVVALDGVILGKPADEAQAARMLRMLSGRSHHVYTGVTLHGMRDWKERIRTFSEESLVHVAQLSEEEIASYLSSGEAMDKAGAYGIQGAFSRYVTHIEGDYFNIVGLPVSRVYRELKKFCES
jgi:septum formation protein